MLPLVLLVDSRIKALAHWNHKLRAFGSELFEVMTLEALRKRIACSRPGMILLGFRGDEEAVSIAHQIHRMHDRLPLILVVAEGSEGLAVSAFRAGVTDYFHALRDEGPLLETLERWLAGSGEGHQGVERSKQQEKPILFAGASASVLELEATVARIGGSKSNVLITGETGTGKELVAAAIHQASARSRMSFVRVNCAAIPDALAESELFGYERGAFTGAYLRNQGRLESAHQGTIFLDEVGDLSLMTQAKLLRAIENKEFRRLGGNAEIKVDVRVVAATNRNLEEMVAERRFREDFYYRLNVARIHLLPLRDRKEDIPVLMRYFVQEFSQASEKRIPNISDEVWHALLSYAWPGNIRELRNVLESAFVNSPGETISIADLPDQFRKSCAKATTLTERQQILAALLATKWNKSRAAGQLRWSRMTLYRKMHKYRISSFPLNPGL